MASKTEITAAIHARSVVIPLLALVLMVGLIARATAADTRATGLKWADYKSGLAQAGQQKKLVLVDFYTPWCRECKKLDKETFSDPQVVKRLSEGFVAVKVDAEKQEDIAARFKVNAYPTLVILDGTGARLCQRIGFMPKDEFMVFLDYASTGACKKQNYLDYVDSRKK